MRNPRVNADGELLERTEPPSLPPAEKGELGNEAAVPAKPTPADPGSPPDNTKPNDATGNKPIRPRHPPDRKFY